MGGRQGPAHERFESEAAQPHALGQRASLLLSHFCAADPGQQCDDFVHVLSLKGSLLYVSPSAKRLLEYEPHELIGKGLSAICHPSDIVSVLRELKDSTSTTLVNLVYRIRRKNSGYMWMEASGKLHSAFLFSSFAARWLLDVGR